MDIEIEFISVSELEDKTSDEKVEYILERVKKNSILVVEKSLTASEEASLIEETMNQVDDKFPGIEVSTLGEKNIEGLRERLIKMLGGSTGGLTVIGPAKLVKRIKKEPTKIKLLAGKK